MATVIKLKRGTSTPTTSNIVSGEVAVDTSAKKFYINDGGTIKELGGGGVFSSLTDVSFTSLAAGDELVYDGAEWVNKSSGVGIKLIPFVKADTSATTITLVNSTTFTTIQGFMNSVVEPVFHLAFTKADGTAVTTLAIG